MSRLQTVSAQLFKDIKAMSSQSKPWWPGMDDDGFDVEHGDEYTLVNFETKEQFTLTAIKNHTSSKKEIR